MPEESERKTRRRFEALHQHVAALREYLLDRLFGGGAVWHVGKVTKCRLLQRCGNFPGWQHTGAIETAAHFNQNRKRRKQTFRIPEREEDLSLLAGKDVIREPGRDV